MKITVCSDLHLELGEFKLIDAPEADVLVLAGDIFIKQYSHRNIVIYSKSS